MHSLNYINAKMYNAVYIFATDEGDARRRLAAAIPYLQMIPPELLPEKYQKDFRWAMETIERGRSKYRNGRADYTLPHIKNGTASKVLKIIVNIQDGIESQLD